MKYYTMKETREFLASIGMPGGDLYDLDMEETAAFDQEETWMPFWSGHTRRVVCKSLQACHRYCRTTGRRLNHVQGHKDGACQITGKTFWM